MEKINFFLSQKRLLSFKVLDQYLCEDIILKIIEHLTFNKGILSYKIKTNEHLKWWTNNFFVQCSEKNVRSIFYLLTGKYTELYSTCNLNPHKDMVRLEYLKNKMSEKSKGHYSKYYNTWIKFQYHLTNSKSYKENVKSHGFIGIKKLSDVLKK